MLLGRYPRTQLEMDPAPRTTKRTRFGSVKHVYDRDVMARVRGWLERELGERVPAARLLSFT